MKRTPHTLAKGVTTKDKPGTNYPGVAEGRGREQDKLEAQGGLVIDTADHPRLPSADMPELAEGGKVRLLLTSTRQ